MGSGSSVDLQSRRQSHTSGYTDCVIASIGILFSSCIYNPTRLYDAPISPTSPTVSSICINKNHLRICGESWRVIASQQYNGQRKKIRGSTVFAASFFKELANLDPENEILQKLRSTSRSASRVPSYEQTVLMKMLSFVLHIKDDSFAHKSRIRAIGRQHARVGVQDESIIIFNEALLRTIARRLDPGYLAQKDVINCWTTLLEFVRIELLIEKVQFIRCDSGRIISSNSYLPGTFNQLSEPDSTTDLSGVLCQPSECPSVCPADPPGVWCQPSECPSVCPADPQGVLHQPSECQSVCPADPPGVLCQPSECPSVCTAEPPVAGSGAGAGAEPTTGACPDSLLESVASYRE